MLHTTSNDDYWYSEYIPEAKQIIKDHLGWYDEEKIFGVQTTLHLIASGLYDINHLKADKPRTKQYFSKLLKILEGKMDIYARHKREDITTVK